MYFVKTSSLINKFFVNLNRITFRFQIGNDRKYEVKKQNKILMKKIQFLNETFSKELIWNLHVLKT